MQQISKIMVWAAWYFAESKNVPLESKILGRKKVSYKSMPYMATVILSEGEFNMLYQSISKDRLYRMQIWMFFLLKFNWVQESQIYIYFKC